MNRHVIRVYGIIVNEKGEILLSDERRFGQSFTKFPGGGLEWGEGLKDGLARELKEELGLDAEIGGLVYVNDFFQQSAFRESDQIISFYYRVTEIDTKKISTLAFDETENEEGEWFRWQALSNLSSDQLTFPIDKHVVNLLLQTI